MMAGNPNWWIMIKNMHPQFHDHHHQQQQQQQLQSPSGFLSSPHPSSFLSPHQYLSESSSTSSLPLNFLADHDHRNQDFPHSWSQLLLGGLAAEEERFATNINPFNSENKLQNWGEQGLNPTLRVSSAIDVKEEVTAQSRSQLFVHGDDHESQACNNPSWSSQVMSISSPRSPSATCSLSSNILDFSCNKPDSKNLNTDHSSECISTATGGVAKKTRVHSSSSTAQPPLKVRKLGDRITALHQLVSPFGKTDTASVLYEAIGYIRFLQGQIEVLSSPYLSSGSAAASMRYQRSVHEEKNSIFNGEPVQDDQDGAKDLKSRGLCLVPVSCTHHVNNIIGNHDSIGVDNYWAPAFGGGF